MNTRDFRSLVYDFYHANRRDFPWRETFDPYEILVSEIMLQQTQTDRVIPKYEAFLRAFPDITALSAASSSDVLKLWQGLGYNRRALYLHQAAKKLMSDFQGTIPSGKESLVSLPGVGEYTASAIRVFAFEIPDIVLETNIRTVFIHHYYEDVFSVSDREIRALVDKTCDVSNPRDWYYALMDYGAYIKSILPNPNRRSVHYTKQSKFEGSDRQIRGAVLRYLSRNSYLGINNLS